MHLPVQSSTTFEDAKQKRVKMLPPCPINYRFALCTDSQILDDFLKQSTLHCYLCNTYSTFLFQNLRIRMMHNETQLVVEILLWIRFISDTYCSHLEFLCQIDHEGSDQKPSETQLKSSGWCYDVLDIEIWRRAKRICWDRYCSPVTLKTLEIAVQIWTIFIW